MRSGSHSNALLVELLIVVIFFMIASTVLLEVFTASRNQTHRAGIITESLAEAQNVADQLFAAENAESLLTELGFVQQDENWLLEGEYYNLEASIRNEAGEAGVMRRQEVRAVTGGETLFTLPCSRWQEAAE